MFLLFILMASCAWMPNKVCSESPKRGFLSIQTGNANRNYCFPTSLKLQGKDVDVRVLNGSVSFIVSAFKCERASRYMVDDGVEENKLYKVVYDLDEGGKDLMFATILNRLQLKMSEREVEIDALTIRVGLKGATLKKAEQKNEFKVGNVRSREDESFFLESIDLDQLASLMETFMFRKPVVNATGLKGDFTITLPSRFDRSWPKQGETMLIGDTGLEFKWEKIKTKMQVISREDDK